MGARITLCDPHRAIVSGPSRLHGDRVESPDIRAGMAMLIAALAAEGTSEIGNIVQIDRGYERIDERLRDLGARIERVPADQAERPGRSTAARLASLGKSPDRARPEAKLRTCAFMAKPCPQLPARADAGKGRPRDDPSDPTRAPGTSPGRDARAARDRGDASRVFERRLRRGRDAHDRVRRGARARRGASGNGAYRFFDERGELLALRSDMTIPIARLAATRFADAGRLPLLLHRQRLRAVRPQRGQLREFRQAGVELIGAGARGHRRGDRGAVRGARRRRAQPGRRRPRGADLFRQLLDEFGVDGAAATASSTASPPTTSSDRGGGRARSRASTRTSETLLGLPGLRGGAEVLERAREMGGGAVERAPRRLQETYEALVERGVADRVQLDLGLLRDLGYYTGAILEVYDPAVGHILGGGGRYDDLLGRFGRASPPPASLSTSSACTSPRPRRSGSRGRAGSDRTVDGTARPQGGPLTLALPRGALSADPRRARRIGFDTAEPRSDSRSLIFESDGLTLVTMRPSDVPTYVECRRRRPRRHREGRADRAERPRRLRARRPRLRPLPHGAGGAVRRRPCERPRATSAGCGSRPSTRARRALLRADRPPGRGDRGQGLGRAGAARRARRRHRRPRRHRPDARRERPRDRRGDIRLHGALVANRVAHKLRVDELDAMVERLGGAGDEDRATDSDGADAAGAGGGSRDLQPAPGDSLRRWRDDRAVRQDGDSALCWSSGERFDGRRPDAALRVEPEDEPGAAAHRRRSCARRSSSSAANVRAVAEAQICRSRERRPSSTRVSGSTSPRSRSGRRASTYPAGRAPYPSSVLMGVSRPRRRRRSGSSSHLRRGEAGSAPRRDPRAASIAGADEVYAMAAPRRSPRSPSAPSRSRAVDVIAGPGSPWVQEAKLQLAGGRHRRLRRAIGARGGRRRHHAPSGSRSTSAPRPSTAPTGCSSPPRSSPRSSTRSRTRSRARGRSAASTRTRRSTSSTCRTPRRRRARRGARARAPRARHRGRRAARGARDDRRLHIRRRPFGDGVRRLRRRLEPRPADRRAGSVHGPARPGHLPATDQPRRDRPRRGRGARRSGR